MLYRSTFSPSVAVPSRPCGHSTFPLLAASMIISTDGVGLNARPSRDIAVSVLPWSKSYSSHGVIMPNSRQPTLSSNVTVGTGDIREQLICSQSHTHRTVSHFSASRNERMYRLTTATDLYNKPHYHTLSRHVLRYISTMDC